jgi:hypothetical protein
LKEKRITTAIGSIRYATTRKAYTVRVWRFTNRHERTPSPARGRSVAVSAALVIP